MQLFASLIVACVVSITPAGAHLLCFDGLSSLLVRDYKKSDRVKLCRSTITGESAGARTRDPNIKSVVAPRPYKSFAYGSTFKGNLLSYGFLSQPRFTQNLSCVSAILTCGLHSGLHQHYF